ncbi:MAG: lipopolysaccharide biosynthesis protein [Candidatus Zixiibacteriota bacterium]
MRNIWDRFIKSKGELTQQVISGGFWVFFLQISSRLLSLITKIVLARILSPEDFGLFGIAMIALTAIEKFSMTGFDHALVQSKKNDREYLDGAWTVQILRGGLIGLILFLAAPAIGLFFKNELVIPMIRMVAIIQFIAGFKNIGIIYFQKQLDFKRDFIFQFTASFADFAVAISLAFLLRNAWAFIFGFMARNIAITILSFVLHPFRPRFLFVVNKIKELFSFGKWVLASSITSFLITEGDDIIVGRMLGDVQLGFYKQAYLYSNLPSTQITHIISRVTFPAYSRLQDDIMKMQNAFTRVFRINSMLSLPVAAAIFVLGPNFVMTVLGVKWAPMIPALQILAIWGAIRSIGATTGPLFRAIGKPQLAFYVQIARLIIMAAAIFPLVDKLGIIGASIVVTVSGTILRPITDYIAAKNLKIKYWHYLRLYFHPALASITTGICVYYLNGLLFADFTVLSLITGAVIFVILYLPFVLVFEKLLGMNFVWTKLKGISQWRK